MCTKALLVNNGTRQPPAAIVRFVVHAAIVWLYAHTVWMSGSVRWDSIVLPTISEVGKYMAFMLTVWTMVSARARLTNTSRPTFLLYARARGRAGLSISLALGGVASVIFPT